MSMLVETLIEFGVVVAVGLIGIQWASRHRLTARDTRVAEVDRTYDVVEGEDTIHKMQTRPVFAGWGCNIHTDIVDDRHL